MFVYSLFEFLSIYRDIPKPLDLIAIAFTPLYFTIRMLGTCYAIYPFFLSYKVHGFSCDALQTIFDRIVCKDITVLNNNNHR